MKFAIGRTSAPAYRPVGCWILALLLLISGCDSADREPQAEAPAPEEVSGPMTTPDTATLPDSAVIALVRRAMGMNWERGIERWLLLGGEGAGLMTGEGVVNGRSVSVTGGYGFFNLGWMFPVAERVRVYPLASLGGGGLTVGIGPSGTSDSFGDILEDPDREARISRGGLLVGGGLGAEVRLGGGDRALLLGLRAGYLVEPMSSAWRMGGNALSGGPDSSLEGLYLRFYIGGGGG